VAQTLGPYTLGQPLVTLPFGELIEATHAARREPLGAAFSAISAVGTHMHVELDEEGTDADELSRPDG